MTDADAPIVIDQFVQLTYTETLPPNLARYADALLDGRILGQRCPTCGRVYPAGKGFCPMDVTKMGEADEVVLPDTGVVTGFTIITPIRYYGQTRTEPFVYASVLLDGASATIGGQDISDIPADQVHSGLRVKAVWKPAAERDTDDISARGWGTVSGCISSFTPTGEPDAARETYEEHLF